MYTFHEEKDGTFSVAYWPGYGELKIVANYKHRLEAVQQVAELNKGSHYSNVDRAPAGPDDPVMMRFKRWIEFISKPAMEPVNQDKGSDIDRSHGFPISLHKFVIEFVPPHLATDTSFCGWKITDGDKYVHGLQWHEMLGAIAAATMTADREACLLNFKTKEEHAAHARQLYQEAAEYNEP